MAGIGFVLERVIDRQGLRGMAGAAAAGVLIVAGPWLISSVALVVTARVLVTDAPGFFAVVVYVYALSLLLFSGYHYRFTRRLADNLYLQSYRQVSRDYTGALLFTMGTGVPAALGIAFFSGYRGWAALAPVLLFTAVNTGWIHTLAASLLQRYRMVIVAYSAGAGTAVLLTTILPSGGSATALMIFSAALLVTGGILGITIHRTLEHRQRNTRRRARTGSTATPGAPALVRLGIIGSALAIIMWADKVLLWFLAGHAAPGTSLWLFPPYDQTVFAAQLLVIPPTVVFIVRVETTYFRGLRNVLRALRHGTKSDYTTARETLSRTYYQALRGQLAVHLAMVAAASFAAPEMVRMGFASSVPLLILTAVGTQLYFLCYALVVNLLYLADYREAVRVLVTMAIASPVVTVVLYLLWGADSAGFAFLVVTALGVLRAAAAQHQGLQDFEWLVMTRVNA